MSARPGTNFATATIPTPNRSNKARVVRSKLKALATSGYANIHRPGAERPDVPLLLKPYHLGDLAKCIRMALDQH